MTEIKSISDMEIKRRPIFDERIYLVPAMKSMNESKNFSLYFEPANRKSRTVKFFGLYTQKNVRYIGQVATVVIGQLDEKDQFKVETVDFTKNADGKPTDEELQRITGAINACEDYSNLGNFPHRYYLFDELEETMFPKTSRGGLRCGREFNLSEWFDYSTAEVAERLRTKEF